MAYVEDSNQCRIPLDSNIIRTKAVSLFNSLRDTDRSNDSLETFVASKGLFERFKDRSGLRSIQMKGEAANADCEAAKEYLSSFQSQLHVESQQIFKWMEQEVFIMQLVRSLHSK